MALFADDSLSQVIKRFKQGEFNVLVSTSIGEEGLDIGEIDMIVCYESQKTPIRMVRVSSFVRILKSLLTTGHRAASTCRTYRPQT